MCNHVNSNWQFLLPNFFYWGLCFCIISISNLKAIQLPPSPPPKQKFERPIRQLVEFMVMFTHSHYHICTQLSFTNCWIHIKPFNICPTFLFYCNLFDFFGNKTIDSTNKLMAIPPSWAQWQQQRTW